MTAALVNLCECEKCIYVAHTCQKFSTISVYSFSSQNAHTPQYKSSVQSILHTVAPISASVRRDNTHYQSFALFQHKKHTLTHVPHLRTVLLNGAQSFCGNVITPKPMYTRVKNIPRQRKIVIVCRKGSRYKDTRRASDHRLLSQKPSVFFFNLSSISLCSSIFQNVRWRESHRSRACSRSRLRRATFRRFFRHKLNKKKRRINWMDGRNGRKRAG